MLVSLFIDLTARIMQPSSLNKHLQSYMKGLSAKVFRTYNASITFQRQLDEGTPENGTVQEKLNHYNHANRMVAILCNHQRAAPKTHEQSMSKMKDRVSVRYFHSSYAVFNLPVSSLSCVASSTIA